MKIRDLIFVVVHIALSFIGEKFISKTIRNWTFEICAIENNFIVSRLIHYSILQLYSSSKF